jgi:hypothetical protein
MSYRAKIVSVTGVSPREAAVIEEVMRAESPTLDALDVRAFNRLARASKLELEMLRVEDPAVARLYEEQAR